MTSPGTRPAALVSPHDGRLAGARGPAASPGGPPTAVLGINVFGDGVRDALDPRATVRIEH